MRMSGVAVLTMVSLFAGVRSQAAGGKANEEAVAKDLQAFKGTWRMTSKEEDGKKFSAAEIRDVIATANGEGRVSVRRGEKVIGGGTIKLNPTQRPRAIDITFTEGEHKGKTALGIYKIDSDGFRVCIARVGDERPTEFSARAGSRRILIVYKREK
jgi:uncharacterized protein (TIGR03067 family)